jgi:hypothetical protein
MRFQSFDPALRFDNSAATSSGLRAAPVMDPSCPIDLLGFIEVTSLRFLREWVFTSWTEQAAI